MNGVEGSKLTMTVGVLPDDYYIRSARRPKSAETGRPVFHHNGWYPMTYVRFDEDHHILVVILLACHIAHARFLPTQAAVPEFNEVLQMKG